MSIALSGPEKGAIIVMAGPLAGGRTGSRQLRIARHEAGHSVMACLFGLVPSLVTIRPVLDSSGLTIFTPPSKPIEMHTAPPSDRVQALQQAAKEVSFLGSTPTRQNVREKLRELRKVTEDLICRHRSEIDCVAYELFDRGEITGKDVLEAIGDVKRERLQEGEWKSRFRLGYCFDLPWKPQF